MSLHESMTVEEHAALVNTFFAEAKHPTLGRPYQKCIYPPMVELLRYLEANGFTCYIVSGGGRDFMRPDHQRDLRHSARARGRQRAGPEVRGRDGHGDLLIQPALDCLRRRPREAGADLEPDRPAAHPVGGQLQRRRRDAACTRAGPDAPSLRLLVLHDDAEREFDYTAGAERALEHAETVRLDRGQHARTTGRPSSVTDDLVSDSGADRACWDPTATTPRRRRRAPSSVDGFWMQATR